MNNGKLSTPNLDMLPLAREILEWGDQVNSRYGPCRELLGSRFEMSSGTLVTKKNMNYSLGWMELLQLIEGVWDPEGIKRVAPNANHSLFTYAMSYGPRVRDQMDVLIETLNRNPDTRQAVLFVAKPENGPTSNLPCTLTIQFLIRNDRLHTIVTMRSWDICRGLPYDIMMFSGLLEAVARCLHLPAGSIFINAGSAHIYDDQLDNIPRIAERRWRFASGPEEWQDFVYWAKSNIPLLEKGGVPGGIEYY